MKNKCWNDNCRFWNCLCWDAGINDPAGMLGCWDAGIIKYGQVCMDERQMPELFMLED
jgi:hypothetical protein